MEAQSKQYTHFRSMRNNCTVFVKSNSDDVYVHRQAIQVAIYYSIKELLQNYFKFT